MVPTGRKPQCVRVTMLRRLRRQADGRAPSANSQRNPVKTRLELQLRSLDNSDSMSENFPAEIRAWIECVQCDYVEKPTILVRISPDIASPKLEKVCVPCNRCGAHAMLHLQRAVWRMR
jgi:hypothetical protein